MKKKSLCFKNMICENISIELTDSILTITLNRPSLLNAINKDMLNELKSFFQNRYKDNHIKGVIITGKGKAFSAGADISEISKLTPEECHSLSKLGHSVYDSIENYPKPVIAAVNGLALGGGCELTMACHIRIASENAKLGQPEVKLGLIPGYGGTFRLQQLIGKSRALEFLMTGEMIDSEIALNIGLINRVTSSENLIPSCKELINKIILNAPLSISAIIKCVNSDSVELKKDIEIEEFYKCCTTEDFKEGTEAFIDKRRASFIGK